MGAGAIVADAAEEFVEGLEGDGFALAADGGDVGPAVDGAEDELGVGGIGGQDAGGGFDVAGGDAEGRMVKGSALEADSVVGEGFHEGDDGVAFLGAEADSADAGTEVPVGGEVAVAGVKVHDLFEGGLAAVVEVGSGEFDVAEAGGFEGTVCVVGLGGFEERLAEGVEGVEARVIGEGGDGGAEETGVAGVGGVEAAGGSVGDRGGGEFGALVALGALDAAVLEVAEALLFEGGEGLSVAFKELVDAGVVGDEGGFVGLDREAPVDGEVGFEEFGGLPVGGLKGGFDEGAIVGSEAEAGGVGVGAEDAIVGGDGLAAEGLEGEEFFGEFGPSAA